MIYSFHFYQHLFKSHKRNFCKFLDALASLETTQVGESVTRNFAKVTILAHLRGFELVNQWANFQLIFVASPCGQILISDPNPLLASLTKCWGSINCHPHLTFLLSPPTSHVIGGKPFGGECEWEGDGKGCGKWGKRRGDVWIWG